MYEKCKAQKTSTKEELLLIAWHPSRWWDLGSVHKIIKKFPQKHIIKMLKFGQKEVTTKNFYEQRQISDIFNINVNKVVASDKVSRNNGKDCHYIIGHQANETLILLFIKTPKDMFSYGASAS